MLLRKCLTVCCGGLQAQELEIPQILDAVFELQKSRAAMIPLTYGRMNHLSEASHNAPLPRRARRRRPQRQLSAR